MRVLLIDNYDSFTFNLLHLIRGVCDNADCIDIIPNNKIDVSGAMNYDSVVVSPGPGIPQEAGNILSVIKGISPVKPILGICLGHQAIAEAFGAAIYCSNSPLHGVQTGINIIDKSSVFEGLDDYILAGRYHSWLVNRESVPGSLRVTAVDNGGNVMAISHIRYRVHGIQFHPESFLTEQGSVIMRNFLKCI